MKKRLSKALAEAGFASRRECETLIFDGKVEVNGQVATKPQQLVSWDCDVVKLNGKRVKGKENKVYYILNKPLGFHCSNKRPHPNSKLVIDLFQGQKERLFTVGRLDKMTEGLILVTNDGELANQIIHPSSGIQKEYLAKVEEVIMADHLKKLSMGVKIEGKQVKPFRVTKMRRNTLKIVVMEGKKHEVRLMLKAAGLTLCNLKRIRIGSLHLGKMPTGSYKKVSRKKLEGAL